MFQKFGVNLRVYSCLDFGQPVRSVRVGPRAETNQLQKTFPPFFCYLKSQNNLIGLFS